jgi:hypothetical protein
MAKFVLTVTDADDGSEEIDVAGEFTPEVNTRGPITPAQRFGLALIKSIVEDQEAGDAKDEEV